MRAKQKLNQKTPSLTFQINEMGSFMEFTLNLSELNQKNVSLLIN